MRVATTLTTVQGLLDLLADADPNEEVTFGKPLKAKTQNDCWCGCGGQTGGKFQPGHDSKFHSLAKQVARGTAEMPESFVNEDAQADFEKHVTRERPLHEVREAAKGVAKVAKDAAKAEAKAEREAAKPAKAKAEVKAPANAPLPLDSPERAALLARVNTVS